MAWERNPGQPLLETCSHTVSEDCMNCVVCGLCKESLDEDDVCDDCRNQKDDAH